MNRILFFHDTFPGGGAEKVTADIANFVSLHGYEVFVVSRKIKNFSILNIKTIELPNHLSYTEKSNIDFIVDVIKQFSIAIFVLPIFPNVEFLTEIKKRTSCKIVFSLHSLPFWEITSQLYTKKKKAKPYFFKTLEWWVITYPKTVWFRKYDKAIQQQHKRVFDLVDAYTLLCEKYKQTLGQKLNIPIDSNKLFTIANGVDLVPNINYNKKKQILYVGRLSYDDKRVDRLLYIWKLIYNKFIDWELIIVGDGSEKNELHKMIIDLKLENVRFVGYQSDPSSFYHDASILCITSSFEGWPLVLTEAQANGVIPFSFNCAAGIEEIIGHTEEYGFLVTPYNLHEYARKLSNLMSDSAKMEVMHRLVVEKAKEYSSQVVGTKWLLLFNSLII